MTLLGRVYLLVALAVAPAFALLVYNHDQESRQREADAEAEALRGARLLAGELEQLLAGVASLLAAAAQVEIVREFREPACDALLQRLEAINPGAGLITVAGPDGRRRCGGGRPDLSFADLPYFQQAIAARGLVIGEHTVGRVSQAPVLPIARRIDTVEGPGMIAAGLRLDWLREHFRQRTPDFPPGSSLTIVDRNGVVLVRLPNEGREGAPLQNFPFIATAPAGGSFRSTAATSVDGVARFVGFTSPTEEPAAGLAVAVGLPQAPVIGEIRAAALRNYALLAAIALLALSAAAIGGRVFIRRPVDGLLASIGQWRRGEFAARTGTDRLPAEFAELAQAFNALAADLEAALRHKDVLLREVNHRVMNNLATISSLLKLQSRGLSDSEAREQLDDAVARIAAIALAYRRMQAGEGVEAMDFAAFLHELCADLQESMMDGDARCLVEAEQLMLPPEQATPLSLIVNELITNAIKHGRTAAGEGALVRVTLSQCGGGCRIAVRNAGVLPEGFDPADASGFGMRMIRAMLDRTGGAFEFASAEGETEFAVVFAPAAPQPVLADDPVGA